MYFSVFLNISFKYADIINDPMKTDFKLDKNQPMFTDYRG